MTEFSKHPGHGSASKTASDHELNKPRPQPDVFERRSNRESNRQRWDALNSQGRISWDPNVKNPYGGKP